jgi:hypothetical protein
MKYKGILYTAGINGKHIMKTIKEAAIEYASEYIKCKYGDTYSRDSKVEFISAINDFRSGAEFAQRWISVKEEVPDPVVNVLIKFENQENYSCMVGCIEEGGDPDCWFGVVKDGYVAISTPTHWRYIELK